MMKHNLILLFAAITMTFSCSDDKTEDMSEEVMDQFSIVGVWQFTELDVTGATGNIDLAEDVLTFLVADGCDVVTFDFKEEKIVVINVRDFTETGIDVNPDGGGLLIECPEAADPTTTVWSLAGDKLSFVNQGQITETLTIELTADTLVIPAEFINEENLAGAKAVFTRQ